MTSSYACKACQADFPFPLNADVVSQPVSAWNTGSARDLESPRVANIALVL